MQKKMEVVPALSCEVEEAIRYRNELYRYDAAARRLLQYRMQMPIQTTIFGDLLDLAKLYQRQRDELFAQKASEEWKRPIIVGPLT